jgi:hypothetical protein
MWRWQGQVSTHGQAQPHGDGVGPWVVEGLLGSIAPGARGICIPGAMVVAVSATIATSTTATIGGWWGTRTQKEHDRNAAEGG